MKYLLYSWLKQCKSQQPNRGFTLIELLVVIIIIGVLSSIALPSFLRIVNLAKETEAKTTLKALVDRQKEHQLDHNSFTDSFESLGSNLPTETENYTYSILADDSLNGALHIAESKHPFVSSYIRVIYKTDSDLQECGSKAVDLSSPLSAISVIADAIANPKEYCP